MPVVPTFFSLVYPLAAYFHKLDPVLSLRDILIPPFIQFYFMYSWGYMYPMLGPSVVEPSGRGLSRGGILIAKKKVLLFLA